MAGFVPPEADINRINEIYGRVEDGLWKNPQSQDDASDYLNVRLHDIALGDRMLNAEYWLGTEVNFDFIRTLVYEHGSYTDALITLCSSSNIPLSKNTKKKCMGLMKELEAHRSRDFIESGRPLPDSKKEEPGQLLVSFEALEQAMIRNPNTYTSEVEAALLALTANIMAVKDSVVERVQAAPRTLVTTESDLDDFSQQLMQASDDVIREQTRLMETVDIHVERFTGIMNLLDGYVDCLRNLFAGEMSGRRSAINDSFMTQLRGVITLLKKFEEPTTVIAITGETSSGKTTLMNGIVSSHCLPVDVDPNTACPIQIIVSRTNVEHKLVIPLAFWKRINAVYDKIALAVDAIYRNGLPLDVEPGPLSSSDNLGARIIYYEIVDWVRQSSNKWSGYINRPPPFIPDMEILGPARINSTIEKINNLLRLVYHLKTYARFRRNGLADSSPLGDLARHHYGRNILEVLPTLYARCRCADNLPYFGTLRLLDTPGMSEGAGPGTLMNDMNAVVSEILDVSNRALVMTTPTTRSGAAARGMIDRVKRVVGQKVMVIVNKFDNRITRPEGVTIHDVLEGYRNEYRQVYNIPPQNVQWLQALTLYNVELGRFSVVGTKPDNAVLQVEDFSTAILRDLAEQCFGGQWARSLARFPHTVEYFNTCVQAEAQKSNFGNVLGMCLLPSFIRALAEFPAEFVNGQKHFLHSVLRSLKTREAVVESTGARLEVISILECTLNEIDTLLGQTDLIREAIRRDMITAFNEFVVNRREPLKDSVVTEVTRLEDSCDKSSPTHVQEGYTFQGNYVSFDAISRVKFTSKEDARAMLTKAFAAVNKSLAESPIEGGIEKVRKEKFYDGVAKACNELSTGLERAWKTFEDQTPRNDEEKQKDDNGDVDKEVLEGIKTHWEKLSKVKDSLKAQADSLKDHLQIEVQDSYAPTIIGGLRTDVHYWFFFEFTRYERYRVQFEGIRRLAKVLTDSHYETPKYSEGQVVRGDDALAAAIRTFAVRISEWKSEIVELIEMMKAEVIHRDIDELRALIAQVEDLHSQFSAKSLLIDQSIAEIEASEVANVAE